MDLETFLDTYGLVAVFGIMLAKSMGAPIPIPADALMLATSARVATGRMALLTAFAALLLALVAGGVVQYSLVRGPGRSLVRRFGPYLGITDARLDAAARRMEKGGALGIGLAILTPGVRSVAVLACGLAGIPLAKFALGLLLGSGLFLALHFFLGLAGGALLQSLGAAVPLPTLLLALAVLLLAGFGVWFAIRRRQRPQASLREIAADAAGAWHEATCPVCLALGAAQQLEISLPLDDDHHHHRH